MTVRIHHLNCGTMCPACERLMNDRKGSWLKKGLLVCHCLLIETPTSLVLVDTGLGTHDIADPRRRLGGVYPAIFRPTLSLAETAVEQIRALGFDPRDVRHILPTHVDLDHVGGLADFPEAQVHVFKPELAQLTQPTKRDVARYRLAQFDHHPRWVAYEEDGDSWFGFGAIRPLERLGADILIIPLIGHTMGHAGVAVRDGERWLLHCGDAYYHRSEITAEPDVPSLLGFFEERIAFIPAERVRNLQRLRALAAEQSGAVELFCAHDPVELARYADAQPN